MRGLERFDPDRHMPVTGNDRSRIEHALWAGWELMVDAGGTVWAGDHEEKIASVFAAKA